MAQTCPKGPDKAPERAAIIADMQAAKTQKAASALMTAFWMNQMRAPDVRAQALLNAATAQRDQGDLAAARDTLTGLIADCPDFTEAYNQRSFVEFLASENKAALADANHVLAVAPDHLGALAGKALVLMRIGRTAEGQLVLRRAVQLDPWLPERRLLTGPSAKKP